MWKLKIRILSLVLASVGAFLIPAGIVFLFPSGTATRYAINVIAFSGVQIAACIFSILALSYIQQKTPNHLIGKVMAYISTITLCAQPLGQTIYGLLYDKFNNERCLSGPNPYRCNHLYHRTVDNRLL